MTDEDIRSIQNFQNQTLIAIKAPRGTTLAVPYPEPDTVPDHQRYQILLKSSDGPVNIYLVASQEKEEGVDDGAPGKDGEDNEKVKEGTGDPGFLRLSPPCEDVGE